MQTNIMNMMNKTIANFVDFNTINNNYLELKKLISKNYSSGDINFFEFLDRYISKPISLNTSIEKILDNIGGKKIKNKYIIIISEGKTKLYPNEIKSIQRIARINKIMIIIIFLSKKQDIKKVIQKDCPHYYDCNLNYLFDISSKVNYKNPFAHYYIKKIGVSQKVEKENYFLN